MGVRVSPEYLAKPLTPFPFPTKDGWMLRTIGDTGAYILALPKKRKITSARRWWGAHKLEEE